MSAVQRKPKKKGLISQLLCCFAPDVENEPSRTQQSTVQQPKAVVEQNEATQTISTQQGALVQSATNTAMDSEKPVSGADQTTSLPAAPSNEKDVVPQSTSDDIVTQQIQAAPIAGVEPALGRDADGTTVITSNSASADEIIPSAEPLSEEKLALLEDEPLSPASGIMTATEPIAETTDDLAEQVEEDNTRWLLPKLAANLKGRKCLVLDLDETLVHSSFKVIHQADFVVPVEIDGIYHNVYVIKRPGVDDFMLEMGKHFEIVVFTASLAKYADPVLDILDIHKVVHHRLFRESCQNHQGNYVKDLSQLGRELKDAIIIDNSPASYVFHPAHAVPISSWFNDVHDTELTDLIPFLIDLTTVEDISQILELSI